MSFLQTHNAQKHIKGAEDPSIVQIYWITDLSPKSPPFLMEHLLILDYT